MRAILFHKWLLCRIVLIGLFLSASTAYPYDRNAQSASWGYRPVYQSSALSSVAGSIHTASSATRSAVYNPASALGARPTTSMTDFGYASRPGYQFQTTSAFLSSLGNEAVGITFDSANPMMTDPWDFDEEDPLGTVTPKVPVGDAPSLLLLLLALAYLSLRAIHRSTRKRPFLSK